MSDKKPPKLETADQVRAYLRERIIKRYKTLAEYARSEGWGVQYVSNVLTQTASSQRPIPDQMLKRFRITRKREMVETFNVRL